MAQAHSHTKDDQASQQAMNNETIQNLKRIYNLYVKQKMPFDEQVRLLSLLSRSWRYDKIMNIFGCSRQAIAAAHRMHYNKEYLLNREEKQSIRQGADPVKIKHFVSWLVESKTHLFQVGTNLFMPCYVETIFLLLVGTYGLTTPLIDNGEKYDLPKQIIQSQRAHALADYKKYCSETGFQSFGKSKLYDIINSIKPAQQKTVAGLDEFVVEGVEAWRSLSSKREAQDWLVLQRSCFSFIGIVDVMPIPQIDRKRLIKQIDMGEQYQKIRHNGHCSEDSTCITHCTTFGLSDSKCAEHYSNCSHAHVLDCPECINIILALDEISRNIEKIADKDTQREVKFDYENASEHIVEWPRHNLRAARQDAEEKSVISRMDQDEAFYTLD